MRVICPDVGGGFGTRIAPHREYALLAVAARKLQRTVNDRRPPIISSVTWQGRDNLTTARMALAEDGRFLGMEVDLAGGITGASLTFAPYIPHLVAPACCRALRSAHSIAGCAR